MKGQWSLGMLLAAVLVAVAGCGGPAPSEHVVITEHDFHIDSTESRFTPGTVYHFVITNVGNTPEEFLIMPRSEGNLSGMSIEQIDKLALAKVLKIAPSQTVTLDYTFPSSAAGTRPEFACYLLGHYAAGMHLQVTVGA